MSKLSNTPRRKPLYLVLALALFCVVVIIAAWTANSSPVLSLNSIVTPTRVRPFAFVDIAKPAVMQTDSPISPLSPVILPTASQTPTASLADSTASQTPVASQTSEPMVYAEIVPDTSASEYVAPVSQGAYANNAPAPSSNGGKYILVDISEQHMYVYEGDTLVYSFVSSTGMHNATRTGSFSVLDKIPSAYGATWDIWMPNWLGIYWAGSMENGIHALPILPNGATLWAGYLGVPISYGCVVLGTSEAQLLYDWADIGTPVEIRW